MIKTMEEIRRVISFREKEMGRDSANILALCLSSRRNMCIHPRVINEGDRETVDSLCRGMTASWVRKKAQTGGDNPPELCDFYENYEKDGTNAEIPKGVFALEDLKELGKERGWCPYFMTRHVLHHCNILVFNYQYMLDPKVSNLVSRELEQESIVVFDEAHNIDNVCIEALSVTLDRRMMEASVRSVNSLERKVSDMRRSNNERLSREYADLVNGLAEQGIVRQGADATMANPVLSDDILQEAVPGNIRKAEHFVAILKKLVIYLRNFLRDGKDLESKTPLAFMQSLQTSTALERKPLRFTYSRLNSLLRTLEVTHLDEFNSLSDIANFVTLVATYMEGFAVILEPQGSVIAGVNEPLLQLSCLDASIAFKPIHNKFQSCIITSGTLSPIDLYPKLLDFQPIIRASLPMSVFRHCLKPLIVTKGSDQVPITTSFEKRDDPTIIRNYGQLLLDVVANVPDGVCCFFTSYSYMEYVVGEWDKLRLVTYIHYYCRYFYEYYLF